MGRIEMKKTVAVVVTYNRKEMLRECIKSILEQRDSSCDIILVDNASTDGTYEMIRENFNRTEVVYYNTGVNLGGAGGFQYGVKRAVLLGYEYIWLMDDDTLPEKTALAELFAVDKRLQGEWGFLSSVAYWTDGNICRMNIQKKSIFRHVGEKEYRNDITPVEMCSFVSLLIKSNVVKEVGLPIKEYFIWTDDYEYTGRISRRYSCYMVTKSKVVHAMKKHTRVNFATDEGARLERYKCIYRNDVHCYRQYGLKGWIYIVLKDIYTAVNVLLNSKDKKWRKIRILCSGVGDGLVFFPRIEMVDEEHICG